MLKHALTRLNTGAPGGIRTPNLLIRRSRPSVRTGPTSRPSHSEPQTVLRARPWSYEVGCAVWLPDWLPVRDLVRLACRSTLSPLSSWCVELRGTWWGHGASLRLTLLIATVAQ